MAATKREVNEQIRNLDSQARKQEDDVHAFEVVSRLAPTDNTTRQKIAKLFVIAYFSLLGLILLGIPVYNLVAFKATRDPKFLQLSLTDTIQTYSAVVGPTLGFVVAYYFKSRNEN